LVGHLWVLAEDPKRAFTITRGVLEELWFAGSLQVNDRFLLDLLSHAWVQEGMFHAGFVDEEFIPAVRPPAEILNLFPGVCAAHPQLASDQGTFRWAVGDQWVKSSVLPEWKDGPNFWKVDGKPGVSGWIQGTEGRALRVMAHPLPLNDHKWQVRIGKWIFPVRRVATGGPAQAQQKKSRLSHPPLLALVPGRVHSLLFRPGAIVPAHEPLLILESLGTLVPHALPVEIRICGWSCAKEDLVQAGQELAKLEPPARN
jgi:hypothetical protein